MKSDLILTRLRLSRQILTENDIERLAKVLREKNTIIHLNLNEINTSFVDFRCLHDNRRHVLDVDQCVCFSDRYLSIQDVIN
jgi:hypothetical protein